MNKTIKNVLCGVLIAGLALVPSGAYALSQDETVYVKLQTNGEVDSVSVRGHLINDSREPQLTLRTNLRDIENLNGFEEYKLDGSTLTWDAAGKDIYYSGRTDQNLPIEVSVVYKLNDQEKPLEEILGQSGRVEITLHYRNLSKVGDLYTPFVVVMETVLSEANAHNIEITNGKAISNGRNIAVTAIAAPGLHDSLRYSSLEKLDKITLSYDTDKFELTDIYNLITPKVLDNNDLKIFDSLDGLYDASSKLSKSSEELVSGTSRLRNGIKELRDNLARAQENLSGNIELLDRKTLDSITDKSASAARQKIADRQSEIRAQIDAQLSQIPELKQLDDLKASLQQLAPVLIEQNVELKKSELIEQGVASTCATGSYDCSDETIKAAVAEKARSEVEAQDSAIRQQVASAVMTQLNVNIDLDKIKETLFQSTFKSMQQVAGETAATTARTIATQLSSSIQNTLIPKMTDLMDKMLGGVDELLNGADQLNRGMEQFDREGIQTLNSLVNNDLKNTSVRIKRLTQLADTYNSFGGIDEGMEGTTKFILMIDGKKQ